MQEKKRKKPLKQRGKQIVIPPEQTEKLHKLFGVSAESIYGALRYDFNSERCLAIREAAFKSGCAEVMIRRPMAQYDIYASKELEDPMATAHS
jgi:hypothetical protein